MLMIDMPFLEILSSLSFPYLGLILIAGSIITIRLRFFQFSHFFPGIKISSGALDEKSSHRGISASRGFALGPGSSIAPGAIMGGLLAFHFYGPGIALWIVFFTPFLMAIQYSTTTLSIRYRQKQSHRAPGGGPPFIIQDGLRMRWFSWMAAGAFLLSSLFQGNLLIVSVINDSVSRFQFPASPITISSVLSIATIFLITGGMKRAGYFARLILLPASLLLGFSLVAASIMVPAPELSTKAIPLIQEEGSFATLILQNAFPETTHRFFTLLVALTAYTALSEAGMGKAATLSSSVRTEYPASQGLSAMITPVLSAIFAIATGVAWNSIQTLPEGSSQDLAFAMVPGLVKASFFVALFLFSISGLAGWVLAGSNQARIFSSRSGSQIYMTVFFLILFFSGFVLQSEFLVLADPGLQKNWVAWITGASILFSILAAFPILIFLSLFVRRLRYELRLLIKRRPIQYEFSRDVAVLVLVLLPKNLISRWMGSLTGVHLPRFLMIPILQAFVRVYQINVDEAELQLKDYKSLNRFFTRALKKGARLVDRTDHLVVSPVDGTISVSGKIHKGKLIQAKHIKYELEDLLEWKEFSEKFQDGDFAVLYLSPQDYHRIHMPHEGDIIAYEYSPGKLFTVNKVSVQGVQGLFPKNERLTTYISTDYGMIAVVKVGAVNVGKIRVIYDRITTNRWVRFHKKKRLDPSVFLDRGMELGRFEMGSTVILLFEKGTFRFQEDLTEGTKVRYGQPLGSFFQNGS